MLATGCLAHSDEAYAVLDEVIALRYTAAQMRFAFLVLLEQEADPQSFHKYSTHLMKDLLDKGLAVKSAHQELLRLLRASWLQNGNSDASWMLEGPATPAHVTSMPKTCERRDVGDLVESDMHQCEAANFIMHSIHATDTKYD